MLDTPLTAPPLSPEEQKTRDESGGILSQALKHAQGEPFIGLAKQLGPLIQQKKRGKGEKKRRLLKFNIFKLPYYLHQKT